VLEKATTKETGRLRLINSKKAELIVGKLGAVLIAIKALLEKDKMSLVAGIIRDPLEVFWTSFSTTKANAEAVIEKGGEGDVQVDDLKYLVKEISEAKKAMALATQMLATIAKAPGA
jgi:hypothetical protein